MKPKLKLRDMLAAGPRAVSKYTGTIFVVHLAQMFVALACMLGVALVLAQTFSRLPVFDEAVDGDPVAMIECVRFARHSFLAIAAIVFAATLVWQLVSWFLVGGLAGVLAQRPEGRGAVARCFGASGAATYLAYARLAIIQLPAMMIVFLVLGTGLGAVQQRIDFALTLPDLIGSLALGALPAIILLHFFWTVGDYVRVELTLRRESHDPSVLMTYARTLVFVLKHPSTMLHGLIGWIAWILVTLAYGYIANGHPMYGSEGAIILFVARQGVALLRTMIRFGVLGGQIELGRLRPLPGTKRGEHRDIDGVGSGV